MSVKRATALERARQRHLDQLALYVMESVRRGQWTRGKPSIVEQCITISGPRAGAIEILAGLNAGRIRKALAADDCAKLRRAIPWDFAGDPQCYMHGRCLRIEAAWPENLAQRVIRLREIPHKPEDPNAWIAGKSETGAVVVPHLDDSTPHYLMAGTTGAGKSVALQNAILQLSERQDNTIVLIDGKYGESLQALARLPGVVGPVAVEFDQVRRAMAWCCVEMKRRYQGEQAGRLVLVIDEFQEYTQDPAIVGLLRKLTAQGRAARVHLLMSTQHPSVDMFGDPSVKRNVVGKQAFLVSDYEASRVAVGGNSPRADKLQGAGDSFVVGPGQVHRVQGAFVDQSDVDAALERANGRAGQWRFDAWPDYDPCDIGQDMDGGNGRHAGNTAEQWSEQEIVASIITALRDGGRGTLKSVASEFGAEVGSTRGRRLVKLGRAITDGLVASGYTFATMS